MNEWMWADELIEAYMDRYECDQDEAVSTMIKHLKDALDDKERWEETEKKGECLKRGGLTIYCIYVSMEWSQIKGDML